MTLVRPSIWFLGDRETRTLISGEVNAGWIQRGGGGGAVGLDPPPEKSQNIGFPSNINLDNLNSQDNQASIQCWAIIGMPVKCHFNGASLADR